MKEYIGYKDATGDGMCNMGLTDEEIIRCRDCEHSATVGILCLCSHFANGYWDAECETDVILRCEVEPDGYCAWAVRRA